MENEKEIAGNENQVETATTEETEKVETTSFTQEQVNDIVRERLERERKSLFNYYGVETKEELGDLIGKSQAYDLISEQLKQLQENYKNLNEEYAFTKNNINPERYEDIKIHFKGKELELNNENLINEITTHPEWLKTEKKEDKKETTIEKISPDREPKYTETEKERAMKLFGF